MTFDVQYLFNSVLLGEEPTVEDLILLVGTMVAFIAFILWCCFPVQKENSHNHRQFSCKSINPCFDYTQVHSGTGSSSSSSKTPIIHNDYIKNGHNCCSS